MQAQDQQKFQFESCVRGHHIYQDIWTPSSVEVLICCREIYNTKDSYAVAVKRRFDKKE
jgi:hypothetical protein